ncbi:hypothetical protein [Aeromonas caviae]|uniref:hypothetical protein n=1 Tax=Aeromonas caviae TaxID=648 RepID=UPI002B45963C|nr:hypothetical protein [Aeromonas caviae]
MYKVKELTQSELAELREDMQQASKSMRAEICSRRKIKDRNKIPLKTCVKILAKCNLPYH